MLHAESQFLEVLLLGFLIECQVLQGWLYILEVGGALPAPELFYFSLLVAAVVAAPE